MAAPTYREFEWHAEGAGNGESGEKLTRVFVELVKKLDGVQIDLRSRMRQRSHHAGGSLRSAIASPESMRLRVVFRSLSARIRASSLFTR